MTTTNTET